jgi:hypothetical protein
VIKRKESTTALAIPIAVEKTPLDRLLLPTSDRLSVRLPRELMKKLDENCRKFGLDKSKVVRILIEGSLDELDSFVAKFGALLK